MDDETMTKNVRRCYILVFLQMSNEIGVKM